MLHYRLEPRKECVRVGRRQNANRPGGRRRLAARGPCGPPGLPNKRLEQAAAGRLLQPFWALRALPPPPPGGWRFHQRQKAAESQAPRPKGPGRRNDGGKGRGPGSAPPGQAAALRAAAAYPGAGEKRRAKTPRPLGGGFAPPQGGLRPPGDSFPGCACPLAPRRRWRCGRGAP